MHFTNGYCDGCNHFSGHHGADGCTGSASCKANNHCEDAS